MIPQTSNNAALAIKQQWQSIKQQNPRARAYDIAREINVSEMELVANQCGLTAIALQGNMVDMFKSLADLGEVMALTRNPYCVIEKTGTYGNIKTFGQMGLVLNREIDLRMFFSDWSYAYAVESKISDGIRRSIQFFNGSGVAIHKVFLKESDQKRRFQSYIEKYKSQDQSIPNLPLQARVEPEVENPNIDLTALRQDWQQLKDVHDFHKMLKSHDLPRLQALRLIGEDFAKKVPNTSVRQTLELARDHKVSIMVFVGNQSIIEIHTGPVENLKKYGDWYNVLDKGFNLHLQENLIDQVWVVKKPTADGIVSSLEFFAADGTMIGQMFGERQEGKKEQEQWRQILEKI